MAFALKATYILLITIRYIQSHDWNYHDLGPDVWSESYPICAGQSQSPINIITACTVYKDFQPFAFSSNYNSTLDFTLLNTGNTITGTPNNDHNTTVLEITGGGLNGTFQFSNFHFHWGENHKSGGEHQINWMKYAGEIHLVFINPITDQIAVLAISIQSHVTANDATAHLYEDVSQDEWQKYFDTAQTLQAQHSSMSVNLSFASLLGYNRRDFWRYEGSLTTPPCTEGLIWTVFKEPIVLPESQLRSFRRNLYLEYHREPQPLYDRTVYRNFINETIPSKFSRHCC